MKLYQITFTHHKTVPHPNIHSSLYEKAAKELRDDLDKPWVFVEKGYRSREDCEYRSQQLTRNGGYSAEIAEYEPNDTDKYIVRSRSQEIDSNTDSKYLVATVAHHLTGDISRDKPNLCMVHAEDKENYYGNWVLGFGFVGVQFPKTTTRPPTDEEKAEWEGKGISISGHLVQKITFQEM